MIIEKIELINFRNIEREKLNLHPAVNIFLGDNGQGKTNILEALYLVCTGQSFRQGPTQTLIREGQGAAVIKAQTNTSSMISDLRVNIESRRKSVLKDNKKHSAVALAKTQGAVLFSPESLSSIKDGAESRRRLVDDLLGTFDKQAIQVIQDFQKQLRARNRLLKNIANPERSTTLTELEAVLSALNIQYFNLANTLTRLRLAALTELLPDIQHAMENITGQNVDIGVEYVISDHEVSSRTPEYIRTLMANRAEQLASVERAAGISLSGPHKHDIRFLFNQKDSRYYCSQGQQRALILAFKMAQIVYHRKVHGVFPVLMLDDVLSELDRQKREKLVNFLAKVDTQIFITTTDFGLPDSLKTEELTVFQVKQGRVTSDR